MAKRLLLVMSLLVALVVGLLPAGAQGDEDLAAFGTSLESLVPGLLAEHEVPGAAVALVQNGEVVWSGGFGFANIADETPVTPDTPFSVASLGKALTAWAALRLAEDSRLDLDAPIMNYVTRWQFPVSRFDEDSVTTRRILSHTAGLGVPGYGGYTPDEELPAVEAVLNGETPHTQRLSIIFPPGTRFQYSGGGYTLLQLALEEISGQTFEDFMQATVFDPLGMVNTTFEWTPELNAATAYQPNGDPEPAWRFVAQAATGLYTTANDLGAWVAAHMATADREAGAGIITPEDVALLQTPAENTDEEYGLGYYVHPISEEGQSIAAWHDGFSHGWRSLFAVLPAEQQGIVILTNNNNGYAVMLDLVCAWDEWSALDLSNYCQTLRRFAG